MTNSGFPRYDFLAASRVARPLAQALKAWMTKFAPIFAERWIEFAPTEISVKPMLVNAMSYEAAQARWRQPTVGATMGILGDQVPGLIVMRRTDVIILEMDILQESLHQRPTDRELTSIEVSLCQLLFQQFATTLGEAWPDKERLAVSLGALDGQPQHLRLFQPQKEVIVTGFEIRTSSASQVGPVLIEWVLAKDETKRLFGIKEPAAAVDDGKRIEVESIHSMVVEVKTELGSAEVTMQDLLSLNVGDIIRLDQRIDAPLVLSVNRRPAMRVWPGRNGTTQCVRIESTF